MVRLMHQSRRGPGQFVTVGTSRYELDAGGCVEVSQEASELLLQGSKWRDPVHWEGKQGQLAAATPPPSVSGARRPRTRDELLSAAEASGIPLEPPAPAQAVTEVPEPDLEPEDEEVTVSLDMRKSELLSVAQDLGLEVSSMMTKSQILDAIESAS